METGIHIEVIWFDVHMMQVLFSCSNGYFSGQAETYIDHKWPAKLVEALRGFPTDPKDSRQFGSTGVDADFSTDGFHMSFYCRDLAGHPVVETRLCGGVSLKPGGLESVTLQIPTEAASIDEFVRQLEAMKLEIGSGAFLKCAKRLA